MLNCQFRNLTAEGGWVAWGVFGTNLNKNFRVENCRLNRIDVHFHCWNLTIKDCEIGFKGISVTGGGDLVIENTIRHGNQFVNFRRDYGSRWEGNIRLIGCTLKPTGTGKVAVLSYHPDDFDYQYQVGFGRRITVEDLLIDFAAAPDSDAPAWLMDIVPFGRMSHGSRLFFPHRVDFRRIAVENRSRGVRLIDIPETAHYDMAEPGSHDGRRLRANCTIVCDDVDLERDIGPGDFHLSLGQGSAEPDAQSLHPRVRFTDCDDVSLVLDTAVASLSFDRCPGSQIHAAGSPPSTSKGLITVNGRVLHSHLNTENAMGTAAYLESEGIQLTEAFVSNLKSRP